MTDVSPLFPFSSGYVRLNDGSLVMVWLDPATGLVRLEYDSDPVLVRLVLHVREATELVRLLTAAVETPA